MEGLRVGEEPGNINIMPERPMWLSPFVSAGNLVPPSTGVCVFIYDQPAHQDKISSFKFK